MENDRKAIREPQDVRDFLDGMARVPVSEAGLCKTAAAYGPPGHAVDFIGRQGIARTQAAGGSAKARAVAEGLGQVAEVLSFIRLMNRPEVVRMVEAAVQAGEACL